MAPDLEYLVFLETRRTVGHTPLGLLVFCLPVSLVLLWVWHRVAKGPLGQLLPDRWAHLRPALDRPLPFGSWAERALAVAAILLGATSHIVGTPSLTPTAPALPSSRSCGLSFRW